MEAAPEFEKQVKKLLDRARKLDPDQRPAFISRACEGNQLLRLEVEAQLSRWDESQDAWAASDPESPTQILEGKPVGVIGRTLGHYKILSFLGHGGMGEVYLAQDTRLGRKVALKLLPQGFSGDQERLQRFEREARSASALTHPNVSVIHEIGETDDGRHFIAMEYIEGITLRQRLGEGVVGFAEATHIAIQVGEALAAAHQAGVIHRDIKPENIMLRPDGYVKVLDFGLAKLTERYTVPGDSEVQTLPNFNTHSGNLIGTTNYLSPEQARREQVDERTDTWSLGVVLYEMLVKTNPFVGQTPSHAIVAILERDPEPLARHLDGVPPELETILARALQKDRDRRYQSAAEFIGDLKGLKFEGGSFPVRQKTVETQPSFVSAARTRAKNWPLIAGIGLLGVLVFSLLYFLVVRQSLRGTPASTPIDSIAVLPFENEKADPDIEYLCDGLTESLMNNLSEIPNMRVTARASVFHYKGQPVDPQRIGRDLKVKALLTGRVVQRGNDFFINMELIDVEQNSRIWGERYSKNTLNLASTSGEMTRNIIDKLKTRIGTDQDPRLAKKPTEDSEAYQLYLKARYYWNKRTRDGIENAIDYYQQAIQKDPKYAAAYAGLAHAYLLGSTRPPKETEAKATEAALKALEIDSNLAEAYAALGFVKARYQWNWPEAEKDYKKALQLDPNSSEIRFSYASQYLEIVGKQDEAVAVLSRAQEVDPLSPLIKTEMGVPMFYSGQYDKAIEQFFRSWDLDRTYWETPYWLGLCYYQKGMRDEALRQFQLASDLSAGRSSALSILGFAHGASGNKEKARQILATLKERSKTTHVLPFNIAVVYLGLGDKQETLDWLIRSYEEQDPAFAKVKLFPIFNEMRQNPKIADSLKRMGLS
jgi:serine/threonine-protein kinase